MTVYIAAIAGSESYILKTDTLHRAGNAESIELAKYPSSENENFVGADLTTRAKGSAVPEKIELNSGSNPPPQEA